MSSDTVPVFIIGSGRSGTRSMYKMLTGMPDVEVHHEFVCTHVQKLAALHYMDLVDKRQAKAELADLHGAAVRYSDAARWIDSSNKLTWLIEPLAELLPNSRFLLIVRDGRKVAGSFFYKLAAEMYDDRSVAVLAEWLRDRGSRPAPPPEKKYWWNIPQPGQPFFREFAAFDQFERACYHWHESNRFALEKLRALPTEQQMVVRLEDMTTDETVLRRVVSFIGVDYEPSFFEFLKTPQNVFFPMDFRLTDAQRARFDAICGPMMGAFGYAGTDAYEVIY